MKRKIAHIEFMRRQYRYNVLQMLWLTGMSEEQFYKLQFETGVAWLEYYTGDDKALLAATLKNEVIWQWWVNEWYKRDNEQYLSALYYMMPKERLSRYRQLHQQIFVKYTPPHSWLEEGYAKAIGEMFDHSKK